MPRPETSVKSAAQHLHGPFTARPEAPVIGPTAKAPQGAYQVVFPVSGLFAEQPWDNTSDQFKRFLADILT